MKGVNAPAAAAESAAWQTVILPEKSGKASKIILLSRDVAVLKPRPKSR